jgi:hypothetical protein
MRIRASAISVPVSLIYAAAALTTGQPIIIALGVIMVVVAAGYLVSELQLKRGLQDWLSASPVKVDERRGRSKSRGHEPIPASPAANLLAIVFVAVTTVLSILLVTNAATPIGR